MLYGKKGAARYKTNDIESQSPIGIVIRLFEGAISFVNIAKIKLAEKNNLDSFIHIGKAQAIVLELAAALDHSKCEEITQNLHDLYMFVFNQLEEAKVNKTPQPLDNTLQILSHIKDTWKEAEIAAAA